MDIISKYFPDLSDLQIQQLNRLEELLTFWNSNINVISRKDIVFLKERHILHSLSIAKIINFVPGTSILDVGTGGGLPGIPLAILFPDSNFFLVDSIGKKIKVAQTIVDDLQLKNVTTYQSRVENLDLKCDFIISRAVTTFPEFMGFVKGKFLKNDKNTLPNGVIYLKGGDYQRELNAINNNYRIIKISDFFSEDFFSTKEIVWIKA